MNNKFSENLKKIRKEHNLSQEQLADELGVSRQAISKWESATAYPEMDKIIALCDKFDVNIDDLLHKDIKEAKKEEESKKKINTFIDDFLKFITDSVNLFSRMNLKSKLKCLLEQFVLLIILAIISTIAVGALSTVFSSILNILPDKLELFFSGLINSILVIICIIAVVVILTHVFKTRYLDYYEQVKEKDEPKIVTDKEEKIVTSKEDKIVIRDPKHSNYRFANGLLKLFIIFIKAFAVFFALLLMMMIVTALGLTVASFLVIKTGLFFAGLLVASISAIVIGVIILLLVLNFIFNRANNKMMMIWSFIVSLIVFGVGCGLVFIGSLDFKVVDNYKTETSEYEMKDTLVLYPHNYLDIEYIESDISNIKVEYTLDSYCKVNEIKDHDVILVNTICDDPLTIARDVLKNINNKKLISINGEIDKITIYASKENINKLEANRKTYIEKSYAYSGMTEEE